MRKIKRKKHIHFIRPFILVSLYYIRFELRQSTCVRERMYFIIKRGNEPDRIGRQELSNSYLFFLIYSRPKTRNTQLQLNTTRNIKKIGNRGR